jgi:hypothetical protein
MLFFCLSQTRFTFPECEAEAYSKSWDLYGFYEGPEQFVAVLADNYGTVYPNGKHEVQFEDTTVELACLNLEETMGGAETLNLCDTQPSSNCAPFSEKSTKDCAHSNAGDVFDGFSSWDVGRHSCCREVHRSSMQL